MKTYLTFALLLLNTIGFAQNAIETSGQKGKFYAYWGWNRAAYTNSDIHFSGNGYDFLLTDVRAKDKQKDFTLDNYFNPAKMTIPQTNFRIGYFLKDNFSVSFGIDHMKYVVTSKQQVDITGEIMIGSSYDGTYNTGDQVILYNNFLQFEHTDGLNSFNFEGRFHQSFFNIGPVKVSGFAGGGLGFILPRTNTTLLGMPRYDEFHLSGYIGNLTTGLNIQIGGSFFIQSELKGGFVNLPDIRTTASPVDRAKQNFFFAQSNFVLGGQFRLWK